MKNLIKKTLIIIGAILLGPSLAFASVFIVPQGGTGKSTFTTGIVGASGTNSLFTSASTTVTCSGSVACTGFVVLGASPITITGSAASSPIATSTSETKGFLPYWTSTAGTPATLGSVATTSATLGSEFSYSGTIGALVGGVSGTLHIANLGVTNGMLQNSTIALTDANSTLTIGGSPASLGGTLTAALNLAHANTWTGLQQFNGNASSSMLSANLAQFGATGTTTITSAGFLGVGSSTPWAQFSVNPISANGSSPEFAIGSSSATHFVVTNSGTIGIGTTSPYSRLTLDHQNGVASSSITVAEYAPATSTAQTVDCRDANTVHVSLGTSATTITLASMVGGQTCKVIVSNPNTTAGAITWATTGSQQLYWAGGTVPAQTTTANKRDVWSFVGDQMPTNSTTTPATNILGAMTANF